MGLQISRCLPQQVNVVSEPAERSIASTAEQGTDLPCRMIVIYARWNATTEFATTNGTTASLRPEHQIERLGV